ncbi:hypothetical protein CesoFtcFv8_020596 [Champsocephalus esox]|uniref:Uncharacterized protein n=1 Tax=Champsocephalus esox TaxID=159716 RepID=A0AAN8BB38_9TELE|nr:hypothetical protein CesoFtcFv8_020596 [Champsocephalus esox]
MSVGVPATRCGNVSADEKTPQQQGAPKLAFLLTTAKETSISNTTVTTPTEGHVLCAELTEDGVGWMFLEEPGESYSCDCFFRMAHFSPDIPAPAEP